MAAPSKVGITYFPLDIDIDGDDNFQMVMAEFGDDGDMVELLFTKFLGWIYKHNGYYVSWNEKEQLKFLKRVSYIRIASKNTNNDIIDKCLKWGIFNKSLFDEYQILTSIRIQKTWLDASRKRKDRTVIRNYWLIPDFTGLKAEETQEKAEETPQSKVKESKVKESNSEANASVGKTKVLPEQEEKELKMLKEIWFKMDKGKKSIYHFIENVKPVFIEPYISMWNIWAAEREKAKVQEITDKRRDHFRARIKEKRFDFLAILSIAAGCSMLREERWFDFDWITKSKDNYIKVLEGKYKDKNATINPTINTSENPMVQKMEEALTKKQTPNR